MTPLAPKKPRRPLIWTDTVLDLQDLLLETDQPVYIVGGAVRDAYLHRPLHDLDLTVPQDAIKLGRQIANALDGNIYVLDHERDVARVLLERPDGRFVVDVARYRGDDLLADLMDRDFTFNAMAVDMKSDLTQLIDPLNGEQDLLDKVLRQCHDQSIHDDPIRALRAIRQSVQLTTRIEPNTLQAIRDGAYRILDVSAERVRDEFWKVLNLQKAHTALQVAETIGVANIFIPDITPLKGLELPKPHLFDGWRHTLMTIEKLRGILQTISPNRTDLTAAVFDLGMIVMTLDRFRQELQTHISQHWADERSHYALLTFGALMHYTGMPDETAAGRITEDRATDLRLSNDEKKRIISTVSYFRDVFEMPLDDLHMHRFWRAYDASGVDMCLLAMANYLAMMGTQIKQDEWIELVERVRTLLDAYYQRYEQIVEPPQLINGDDLMALLDLKPGKHIGELLTYLREAQVVGDIQTREDAIQAAEDWQNRTNE